MSFRKSLLGVVFGGVATLGLSGCDKVIYDFNEKIDGEYLSLYETRGGISLEVKKTDGRIIKYNLKTISYIGGKKHGEIEAKVTRVEVTEDNKKIVQCATDIMGGECLKEAQKQFDGYLTKIRMVKQTNLISSFKN
ncbi:hypothetical protein HY448_00170 [Candidatus Pacearchaeota archaeon]|nr:hypothetical protein [Candidatus Pacearchaeota archaeon]